MRHVAVLQVPGAFTASGAGLSFLAGPGSTSSICDMVAN
jgi:hypothetical protein